MRFLTASTANGATHLVSYRMDRFQYDEIEHTKVQYNAHADHAEDGLSCSCFLLRELLGGGLWWCCGESLVLANNLLSFAVTIYIPPNMITVCLDSAVFCVCVT